MDAAIKKHNPTNVHIIKRTSNKIMDEAKCVILNKLSCTND